ncbi:MAG: efflux RND transporter permease subunit [Prochloraceae cyanobacterium]|nr:efflux RND transporter permease subunit [Prochloraceae cyanobacterium]
MWSLFYRNSRLLILSIFLILVWGLSSWQILPRMEDPEFSQWNAYITTRLPGASAYRVESLVTDPIEQELLEIDEIKTLESSSRVGNSTIFIQLKDSVKNHDEVWSRMRDRLADVRVKLPPDSINSEYIKTTAANTLIAALTWNLESPVNYAILRRWAEELEDELRNLSGTEQVELFGAPSEEIVVEINPSKLATLGLTPQQLSQQIRLSDAKVAAGQLRSNNNLLLEVQTQLDHLNRIRQIPIHVANGTEQLVRLGDIAVVKKGIREPPSQLALIDERPAIALAVLMEPNQRIDRWSKTARQTLDKFRERLPLGIDIQLIFDQSPYVNNRLNNLFKNLLLGALCVVVSTVFMMGWKSALVVGSSLPLSVLMVFGGMRVLEIPLHQMSVTGLVIALGLLIDNAIVVVDEIQNLLQKGLNTQQAISQSIRYLTIPLSASTLTTVLTFMPIVLVPGPIGEFVKPLGISVILALFSSLFLSLTIIPALIGRIKKIEAMREEPKIQKEHFPFFPDPPNWWNKGFSHSFLTSTYRQLLSSILRIPILGITLSLIVPVTGFLFASTLPEQLFPPSERDQFPIELELPASASLFDTQTIVEQAQAIILRHSEVIDVHWFIGTNAPKFYVNLPTSGKEASNYANGIVQITSASESRRLIQSLQQELDEALPSAQVFLKQLDQTPGILAPVVLRLYGSDLKTLQELGNQTRKELAQVTNVTHTRTSLGEALPKLALFLDEEQAQLTGLDNTQIAQQLNANLEGNIGGSIFEDTEELPVRVRLSNSNRADLEQITTLDLVPNNQFSSEISASLPLSVLGQINLVPETAIITRRNGQRVNKVQGFITAGVLSSNVLADFKQRLSDTNFQLPPGYSMDWGGESAERNDAVGNLLSTVGILIVLMVATLVLSFNSFRSAGIIFLVAIGSVGLALASLWFFGYPFGLMAILGTVGLIGVAINDSIVVLAAIRNDRQARKGNRRAMVKVIIHSTRHVLTTTITTIAGFIPLFLDGGEFWPPLAICIAGGVGGATLLALFFVPCAYLLLIGRNYPNFRKLSRQRISYQLKKVMRKLVS